MTSGSCLSASTMAVPTMTGSSATMSAYNRSSASARPASSMDPQMCSSKKQDKTKKRVVWGIEVAEELLWKGWELGKEVTKNLALKNLSFKIQKMKYRYEHEGPETPPLSSQADTEKNLKNVINSDECIKHVRFEELPKVEPM